MDAPIVHGGGITEAARLYGGRVEDWLDLSTGINPNPVVLPDIPDRCWHRLPDHHLVEAARSAAAEWYRSGTILPLPVPGTQSVIQLLPRLLTSGRRGAVFGPTYGEYVRVLRAAGVPVDEVAGFDDLSDDHGLVVLVNPNNPTGRLFSAGEVLSLHQRVQQAGGTLVVDEAFGDMTPEASVVPFVEHGRGLVVFRSFGKFFGLAGLRLGFVIAHPAVQDVFSDGLGPWAVSGPALSVAASLLGKGNEALREDLQSSIEERKSALDGVLTAAGLEIAGGTGLFTLVAHHNAGGLQPALCGHGILTRAFGYAPSWLRVGLTPNAHADRRLAKALTSLGALKA